MNSDVCCFWILISVSVVASWVQIWHVSTNTAPQSRTLTEACSVVRWTNSRLALLLITGNEHCSRWSFESGSRTWVTVHEDSLAAATVHQNTHSLSLSLSLSLTHTHTLTHTQGLSTELMGVPSYDTRRHTRWRNTVSEPTRTSPYLPWESNHQLVPYPSQSLIKMDRSTARMNIAVTVSVFLLVLVTSSVGMQRGTCSFCVLAVFRVCFVLFLYHKSSKISQTHSDIEYIKTVWIL